MADELIELENNCHFVMHVVDEIVSGSVYIPVIKPDLNKANPKLGVSVASFSTNCRYLFTKNGERSITKLFIYSEKYLFSVLHLHMYS